MRCYDYRLFVGFDVSGWLYHRTFDHSFEGFGVHLNGRIHEDYHIEFIGGSEKYTLEDPDKYAFSKIQVAGNYFKLGIFDNMLDFRYGFRGIMFYGMRYGYANYRLKKSSLGGFHEPYWTGDKVQQFSNSETSLEASHFLEVFLGTRVELLWGLSASFQIRASTLLSDRDALKVLYIPGYGENRNPITLGLYYVLSYAVPLYTPCP